MTAREARVEIALGAAIAIGAVCWALADQWERTPALWTVGACLIAYAAGARVRLFVGAGAAVLTQLTLVPMLYLLPPALVPLAVVTALVAAMVPDVVRGREDRERLLTAVGDAGYAFAPAVVLALGGAPAAPGDWALLAAAFAAQCSLDAVLAIAREWLGRGVRPAVQLTVMASVYGVDLVLLPLAVAIAAAAVATPAAVLAILPLIMLLAAVARDRNQRLGDALDRLEDLESEHGRVQVAIQRIGRALGERLDRSTMLEIALGTAVDAVGAAAGRVRLAGSSHGRAFEAIPRVPGAAEAQALLATERAGLAGHDAPSESADGWWAMARRLVTTRGGAIGTLAVCRRTGPFSPEEATLFGCLAAQAAAAVDAAEMHERLLEQVERDELTGLISHRRFHELLAVEVERSRGTQRPLSVLLIDLDRFRLVNAAAGHAGGDEVLRAVGARVRERCRITDEPARYAGQQLAVALAGLGLDEAWAAAEELRTAIRDLRPHVGAGTIAVTASVGVAELSPRVPGAEALIFAAETALDEAKQAGRDRSVGFRGPYRAEPTWAPSPGPAVE